MLIETDYSSFKSNCVFIEIGVGDYVAGTARVT